MKTLLVNASAKNGPGASGRLLELMRRELQGETAEIGLHGNSVESAALEVLKACDRWIFFSPLYVDSLPSHLLSCLVELEEARADLGDAEVYGVINCGFFEGEYTRYALEVLENWADRLSFRYGGGIGAGCGGAPAFLPDTDKGPIGPIVRAIADLAARAENAPGETKTTFVTVAVPRFLYKLSGEAGWRRDIRRNGGRARDLGTRRQPAD